MDKQNISYADVILHYLFYLNKLNKFTTIRTFLAYRRIYRNYGAVMMNIVRSKYPIKAIMRNGNSIVLNNPLEAQLYGGRHDGFEYDIAKDIVTISRLHYHQNKKVTIYGGITNGDIRSIFVFNAYQNLPVRNKIVIDIGGNIADSAIYFVIYGATKIICLEPFPKHYQLAAKNIRVNNFSNNIKLFLAGVSTSKGVITVDDRYHSRMDSRLREFKTGIKVPLMTLEDILDKNNLPSDGSIILKIDCEGCEYDTILSASEITLQKFSHIMIEYHYGYKDLQEKLEKSGFTVLVTRPTIYKSDLGNLREGYIFAKQSQIN